MMHRLFLFTLLIFNILNPSKTHGQNSQLTLQLEEIKVDVKGTEASSTPVSVPIYTSKTSPSVTLFSSDSLTVSARYKVVSYNSPRSQVKDSSIRLHIFYTIVYHGVGKDKKSEKMFFLNENLKFAEKETFNINTGKLASTLIKVSYSGLLNE